MKRSNLFVGVVVALTVACMTADANGFFGRRSRQCCDPCPPNCDGAINNQVGAFVRPRPGYPDVQTLYYCIGGFWVARACGTDVESLKELAIAELDKPEYTGGKTPNAKEMSISVFGSAAKATNWVIADFSSLDGQSCN